MALQLTKKRDAAPAAAPVWHPNFRDFERLPDSSAVRKSFFVSAIAVLFAVMAAGWLGWHEFQARSLRQQTEAAEAEIASNQRQNAEALRLTKLFTDEEKKFTEASEFVKAPIRPSELLLLLGSNLPNDIQLQFVEVRWAESGPATCTLRGHAAGPRDQASGAASAYVETLRTTPRFNEMFESVNLTTLNSDARVGMLIFEIVLKFKPTGKGGK